jgi:hypothetical protein
MKKLFLVGLLAVAAANATITPFLVYPQGGDEVTTPPACTVVGTDCRYDYSILIEAGYEVMEGDFFTIYDFNDIVEVVPGTFAVGTSGQASDWTAAVSLMGPTAPVAPGRVDDANVHNVTYTYNGTGINTGPIQGGGDIILSGFWAMSSSDELAVTHFSAGDNRLNPPGASANGSTVFGPAGGGNDTVVPEPMSMALLGGGLSVLGLLRFRKRS